VGDPPPHVVAHYRDLEPHSLLASVLAHYQNMGPLLQALIRTPLDNPAAPPLVLEGSALLPQTVAQVVGPDVEARWLTAGPDELRRRMHLESGYDARPAEGRLLVDRFLARALLFDAFVADELQRLGWSDRLTRHAAARH
ncbi:MAG TPA: hypothetical protein VIO94_07150, partial [Phenylobacterium sp.]